MEPDPNLADLIAQAKAEILEEINLVRAEEEIGNVNALIDEYTIYLNNPPTEQTIEAWIRDAINVTNQFEIIIANKAPRIAYLSAKAYNMLIPLMALMMEREDIRTADILPLFQDVITTNQVLIGSYCWADSPNVPIYWNRLYGSGRYEGKLLKCWDLGIIDWEEYLTLYDLIWTANEALRRQTIPRYTTLWFHISNEQNFVGQPISPENNRYLRGQTWWRRAYGAVTMAPVDTTDTDFLWRLVFHTPRVASIQHWSGKCLTVGADQQIVLAPMRGDSTQWWSFDTWYPDRPTIRTIIGDELCLRAETQTVSLIPRGYTPGESQRWLVLYACRRGSSVGSGVIPAPADYDGDGRADLGVQIERGEWRIDFAADGFGDWNQRITTLPHVGRYACPAVADYDGDGLADLAIKHDSLCTWYIDYAANGYGSWDVSWSISLLTQIDRYTPLPGDYDGDGRADIAVRSDIGAWYINYAANGFAQFDASPHAYVVSPTRESYPAPADYDADGATDISEKSDDGQWRIDYATDGFYQGAQWDWVSEANMYGGIDACPLPGEYNGINSTAELAVRTAEGCWMTDDIFHGYEGLIDWRSNPIYGSKHACPIPADYDGDGGLDISVIEADGHWAIDYSANGFGFNRWDWSTQMRFTTGLAFPGDSPPVPDTYQLANYPNPFNAETTIYYTLANPGHVRVTVYNVTGHKLVTVVDTEASPGVYHISWDGRDQWGQPLPTGIYLCQLRTRDDTECRKMVLVK